MRGRSVFRDDRADLVNLEVQAGANDVVADLAVGCQSEGPDRSRYVQRVADAAQVHMEVFELRRPLAAKMHLGAGANHLAALGKAGGVRECDCCSWRACINRSRRIDPAPRATAGDVKQPVVVGPANSTARRSEPFNLLFGAAFPIF